ncbi:arylamine N-acetyltransferase, pineal gland isozyme NAT-10-like [Styela clava]
MELGKLLKRMKYSGPTKPADLNLLNELCIHYVSSIPYENLDLFGGKKRIHDLPTIYGEIVMKNRGGMCIESNSLLHWMLGKIGFDVTMCMAYSLDGNDVVKIVNHMVLLVKFDADDIWLVDVGYGGLSFVFPLEMKKLAQEQSQPNGVYMITKHEGIYAVEKKRQVQLSKDGQKVPSTRNNLNQPISKYQTSRDWELMFVFRIEPKTFNDFHHASEYAKTSHPWCTKNSTVVLQDRERRVFLVGDTLVEKRYVDPMTVRVVEIQKYHKTEIPEILKSKFGIVLSYKLQPESQMTWFMM